MWFLFKIILQENAALCDEVAKVQESIMIVKEERKFLLHKILEYENDPDISQPYTKNELMNTSNTTKVKLKKRQSLEDTK